MKVIKPFVIVVGFVALLCADRVLPAQPLYLETPTAAAATPWLKALQIKPSPKAVVDAMNPYHIQRIFPDSLRRQIHQIGMLAFYSDPVLMKSTLSMLHAELRVRSDLMRAGGLYYGRNLVGEGFWEIVEPQKGVFQFEITDALLSSAAAAGGSSLLVIQPYSSWDQKAGGYAPNSLMSPAFIDGDFFALKDNTGPSPVFDLRDYRDFLLKLKQHTGQQLYEIANEMDGGGGATYPAKLGGGRRYTELLKVTRDALGPDTTIVNGGSIGFVPGFIEKPIDEFWKDFFDAGGGSMINVLNIHYTNEVNFFDPKASTYDPTFKQLKMTLDYFNKRMIEHSAKKDIWITEFPIGDRSMSEQQIAEWYVKRFSFAAARGVKKVFVEFSDFGQSIAVPNLMPLGRSAMLYKSGSTFVAQLTFYTQKLMNLKLAGFTGCTELVFGEQYQFSVNGRPVFVLWGGKPLPDTLQNQHIKITDVFGNIAFMTVPANANVEAISGSPDKPVFVELD